MRKISFGILTAFGCSACGLLALSTLHADLLRDDSLRSIVGGLTFKCSGDTDCLLTGNPPCPSQNSSCSGDCTNPGALCAGQTYCLDSTKDYACKLVGGAGFLCVTDPAHDCNKCFCGCAVAAGSPTGYTCQGASACVLVAVNCGSIGQCSH